MNKTIKTVLAVLVVLTLCVGMLVGCSGGSPVGTWKFSSAEAMGQNVSAEQLGEDANTTITLNADGTITTNGITGGKWEQKGDTISFTQNGITIDYKFNGSNIILDLGIAKITYSRA